MAPRITFGKFASEFPLRTPRRAHSKQTGFWHLCARDVHLVSAIECVWVTCDAKSITLSTRWSALAATEWDLHFEMRLPINFTELYCRDALKTQKYPIRGLCVLCDLISLNHRMQYSCQMREMPSAKRDLRRQRAIPRAASCLLAVPHRHLKEIALQR